MARGIRNGFMVAFSLKSDTRFERAGGRPFRSAHRIGLQVYLPISNLLPVGCCCNLLFHGIKVETRTRLHGRILNGSFRQLGYFLL